VLPPKRPKRGPIEWSHPRKKAGGKKHEKSGIFKFTQKGESLKSKRFPKRGAEKSPNPVFEKLVIYPLKK